MPFFEYKGATAEGKQISGSMQAENLQQAKAKLKADNVFLFEIKNKMRIKKERMALFSAKRVDIKTLCTTTRLLAVLIKSNVPLVDSLTTVLRQVSHPVLVSALTQIRNQVNEGQSFHRALGEYPKIFNSTYVSLCEAGESSGTLDIVLLKLAEFTESQAELNHKIRSALAYPILMMIFAFGVVMFLFTYVIPKITTLFEGEEVMIPWYTEFMLSMSNYFVNSWPQFLLGVGAVSFLAYRWTKSSKGKDKMDALYLKLPVVGKIIRSTSISRFSRTLATLLKGGVPMLKSMEIVQNVANNAVLKRAIKSAKENIHEGEPIAEPLKKSGQFPPMVIQMIKTGEKTGELENMLIKISDTYDFQVDSDINTLTSLLAPAMVMIMGGVVGFIVFSVMMPILEMYNQVG